MNATLILLCLSGCEAVCGFRIYEPKLQDVGNWTISAKELAPLATGLPLLFELVATNSSEMTIAVETILTASPEEFRLFIHPVGNDAKKTLLKNHYVLWGSAYTHEVKPGEKVRILAAAPVVPAGDYVITSATMNITQSLQRS